jgi:thioredoxin-dependent peroxiredoxin
MMRLLSPIFGVVLLVGGCAHETSAGFAANGTPANTSIALRDQANTPRTLADFRGRPLVVYFYPRDETPGCTREACAFRDAWDRYASAGIHLVGVSTDDVASHAAFAREHELPFTLLADVDGALSDAFGVRRHLGRSSRVTFLVDAEGVVRDVIEDVDPGVHADEVIRRVTELGLTSGSGPTEITGP